MNVNQKVDLKRTIGQFSIYLVFRSFYCCGVSLISSFWRVKENWQLRFLNWSFFSWSVSWFLYHKIFLWDRFYLNKYQTGTILTFIPYLSRLQITPNNFVLLLVIFKALAVFIWKSDCSTAIIADYSLEIFSIFL